MSRATLYSLPFIRRGSEIELDPSGRAKVLKVATPPLREAVPRVVELRLNITEPVGVPPNCPDTVEVKITVWPTTEGLTEDR